jgi:hemolysin III
MDWLPFREPVSAGSHAAGALLAVPAAFLLCRRCAGDRLKQVAFLVFGGALLFCYLGSALYHAVRLPPPGLEAFAALDNVGIYLLIAGTITPVALVVLRGRWRRGILASAWGAAACGISLRLGLGDFPPLLCTGVYLAIGWGILLCYFELARVVSHQALRPLLGGAVLYTVGAFLNVLQWPVLMPGVVGPHEVFHGFVLAGSLAHFWFMLRVVVPFAPPAGAAASCLAAGAGGVAVRLARNGRGVGVLSAPPCR